MDNVPNASLTMHAPRYNYNREDDEIYREFHEIANEIIPNVIRACCAESATSTSSIRGVGKKAKKKSKQYEDGDGTDRESIETKSDTAVTTPTTPTTTTTPLLPLATTTTTLSKLLEDSECYGDLLRFFDGICEWEEGSCMPVLHIIWANNMTYTVSKFLPIARSNLRIFIKVEELEEDIREEGGNGRDDENGCESGDFENSIGDKTTNEFEKDGREKVDCGEVKKDETTKEEQIIDKTDKDKITGFNTSDKENEATNTTNTRDKVESNLKMDEKERKENKCFTRLLLRSEKMVSMRDLLTSDKLNTSAIKLLLTAQSQVNSKSTSHLFNKPSRDGGDGSNGVGGGRVNNNGCGLGRNNNSGRINNGGSSSGRVSNSIGSNANSNSSSSSTNLPSRKRARVSEG